MAQSIRNLALGSKIRDSLGNKFIVIAHDHYSSNEVTLMSEASIGKRIMNTNYNSNYNFGSSDLSYYLNNDYLSTLDSNLRNSIKISDIPYRDLLTHSSYSDKTLRTKVFIPSLKETGVDGNNSSSGEVKMPYLQSILKSVFGYNSVWTRTEYITSSSATAGSHFYIIYNGSSTVYRAGDSEYHVFPIFNLNATSLVSDSANGGYYSFIFNVPPVIKNISNIKGNYGSRTDITYTVTDNDDSNLSHYISLDNGSTYTSISPNRVGDNYTYSHVFNVLGTYYCRIKVTDSAGNSVTSNGFTVELNSVAPIVNIVSVVDKIVTFKTSCQTHSISKVEILINGVIVKTYTNGFDFNLIYEIDRTSLNAGKNAIRIMSTSTGGLSTHRDIEVTKTTYNLPPAGTKVIIGSDTYSITNAKLNGSNQIYTLEKYLLSNVSKGQEIKITQDSIKVLCSLSNLENTKDFKEMKLVKTKKLKGQFEGYVEEKYELENEGRYSAIKIQTERFNNNIESEIIELQQYFDYMED